MRASFVKCWERLLSTWFDGVDGGSFVVFMHCHSNSNFDSGLTLLVLKYCEITLLSLGSRRWYGCGRALSNVAMSN